MLETLKIILCGIGMGVANVIPGVSGGMLAVTFNLYDRIVACTDLKNLKKNLPFLIKLLLSVAAGILLFSKVIVWLFDTYPTATQFAFLGLVLGSLPLVFRRTSFYLKTTKNNKVVCALAFLAMLGILIGLLFVGTGESTGTATYTTLTPLLGIILFGSGALGGFTMILPGGVSGSFVLVALGVYNTVLTAINGLTDFQNFSVQNIFLLLPFGFGVLAGIFGGLKLVKTLFDKAAAPTYCAISGMMLGAIPTVFPFRTVGWNLELLAGILVMIAGTLVSFVCSKNED